MLLSQKTVFCLISFKFVTGVDVNKCFKQIKLHIILHTSYYEKPSNISNFSDFSYQNMLLSMVSNALQKSQKKE